MINNLHVESRRKKPETIKNLYPEAIIVDVTSKAPTSWVKFSPFYPIGNIPIPYSNGRTSKSVEGLWQGLKVFESQDIDPSKFAKTNMKGLKRTVRKYGRVLGHRKGVDGELIGYLEARRLLYVPSYNYVLENYLKQEIELLLEKLQAASIVLLDYETNVDIENLSKPLSHASLIARYIKKEALGSRL